MQKLSKAEEYADHLIEFAQRKPEKLLDLTTGGNKWKSIQQRLIDLYIEETKKQPQCKRLKTTSHLLEKLVKKEHLNTLIIKLYPSNEGYSLMLRGRQADSETITIPYEESELLEYIDNEELPPVLIDLLDKAQANIFYSGCVIVELRDFRRSANGSFHTRYVLLKPTSHTLLCDINMLTSDGHRWTQEDKFQLESQLLLHTNEPLCLDPSPAVFYVNNKLHYEKQKLNNYLLKRSVKKYSQTAVNRKRKISQCAAPKHLFLHDFLLKKKEKSKGVPPVNLKVGKTCVDMWRQKELNLSAPESVDVDKYAKCLDKPKLIYDNTPITVEEYTLETERSQGKVYLTKLIIQQRMTDDFYMGELYADRDYKQGQVRGATCRFPLGTRAMVEKYIKQFTEIFTEEGRRSVKITHQVPGQAPTVTFTQTLPSYTAAHTSTAGTTATTQTLLAQAQTLAASIAAGQVGAGGDAKRPQPPIKLSLQISPQISGAVSPGAPQQSPGSQVSVSGSQQVAGHQMTLSLHQQQQLVAAQRARQIGGIYANISRGTYAGTSPASTPTGQLSQLPTYTQATAMATTVTSSSGALTPNTPQQGGSGVNTPSATPPPLTPGSNPPSRRQSMADSVAQQIQLSKGVTLVSASSAPPTPTTPSSVSEGVGDAANQSTVLGVGGSQQSGGATLAAAPNVNIANLQGIPQNISIQNLAQLQGLQGIQGIANLQGLQALHNVQVSLPGGLTVPVPLSMINSGTGSTLSTPTGILVSSLPGVQPTGTSTDATTTVTQSSVNTSGIVTMVTAIPASSGSTTGATTSGVTSSMLSLPIGVTGNLTQFMTAANLKAASGNIRQGAPLSLLQIPGQQPVQLLSTANLSGQARAQIQQLQQANSAGGSTGTGTGGSTGSKQGSATNTTAVLPAQTLTTQAMMSIPQLATVGRTGQPLTTQQLVQLSGSQVAQLAFSNKQLHPIQLQQLQQKPTSSKSKKRRSSNNPKS